MLFSFICIDFCRYTIKGKPFRVIQDLDYVANDNKLVQMVLNWWQEFLQGVFKEKMCF